MPKITLVFAASNGKVSAIDVMLNDSPLAAAVLIALGTEPCEALQVRWSGEGFYIPLPESEIKTMDDIRGDTHDLSIGQVVYHLDLREVAIAYGEMRFQQRDEALDCFVIGYVLTGEYEDLVELGKAIHRHGVHEVTLSTGHS